MKKLTITIKDEFLTHVLGAVLKTGADFTVETVGAEEPQPPPAKKPKQFFTEDGKRPADVILDKIATANGRKVSYPELKLACKSAGFHETTANHACKKLVADGLIQKDGIWYKAVA